MSLFDIFKTRWSPGSMTQDDRKKLFWYLKRKTSYTAWKREADAFDRFAGLFEKQVKEEPVVRNGPYKTSWDSSYPEILKIQLFYEQGLDRLKHGDRTVWLYNDRGILRDAWMLANSWHSELVNHGFHGDKFFDGKYVEEMTEAMKGFFLANCDAGYVQSRIADTPAREFWGEWMECVLNNEEYPRESVPGMYPIKHSRIEYSRPLPEVPSPTQEVLIKTGENTPVFGIYEPQIRDGCMNYLLQDVPAPLLKSAGGQKSAVIWRLLWEDTRYLDGEIPMEENRYFPIEKTPAKPASLPVDTDLLSIATGQLCPQSGTWAVTDDLNARAALASGDIAPQHDGRDVVWVRAH